MTEAAPVDHGPARPWTTCILPFAVFLAGGLFEPAAAGGDLAATLGIPAAAYPVVYALRIAATAAALAWCWPALVGWVGRPTWWPPLVGLALVVPWIVLAALQREAGWASFGGRSAYDPFASLAPDRAWAFLAVRWLGLVVIVPIVEELFLRGFLMRYVVDEDFRRVPFGLVTPAAAAVCAAWAIFSHPAEAGAALAWFAVVTGIAAATRRPIDCILAHAATNLALGAWVLATGDWWLV